MIIKCIYRSLGQGTTNWSDQTYNLARLMKSYIYSVSQKKSPDDLWQFFQNRWEFFNQILHAYFAFLSTLDYKFYSIIYNLDEVMPY